MVQTTSPIIDKRDFQGGEVLLQGFWKGAFLVSRDDLTEFALQVIAPLLPNKPRRAARVDDRRVAQAPTVPTSGPWSGRATNT